MRDRTLQAIVFGAWTAGVAALAAGMFVESARLVAVGAWTLFVGVAVGMIDSGVVVGRAFVHEPGRAKLRERLDTKVTSCC